MKYKLIIDKNAEEEIIAVVHSPSSLTQKIEDLVHSYSGEDGIMAHGDDLLRKLEYCDIECIAVLERKVVAIDRCGKRYYIRDSLRELESRLPSYFIRINKSALANEHCIVRFDATFSGGVDAVFMCGYREYVSRRCFREIRRRYDNG